MKRILVALVILGASGIAQAHDHVFRPVTTTTTSTTTSTTLAPYSGVDCQHRSPSRTRGWDCSVVIDGHPYHATRLRSLVGPIE